MELKGLVMHPLGYCVNGTVSMFSVVTPKLLHEFFNAPSMWAAVMLYSYPNTLPKRSHSCVG